MKTISLADMNRAPVHVKERNGVNFVFEEDDRYLTKTKDNRPTTFKAVLVCVNGEVRFAI